MSDIARSLSCPVLVLCIEEERVTGDTLADALRDEFLSLHERTRVVHVIIDMDRVRYISSAGLRPLLALGRLVREREGRVSLTGMTADVAMVFEATRLVSTHGQTPATFERHDSVPAAVTALYA